ncbi:NAD(P)-binding protein [Auriculariales sp. MPI-PUGE-AT-0066]|nr:NAD(P)-binding protein [Auriculariales sp. MPI-PUGE-AT-0066]
MSRQVAAAHNLPRTTPAFDMSPPHAVVYVTGASRGLGLAIIKQLLADGVGVVTLQRTSTPELDALVNKYPETLINVTGSVTEPSDNATAVTAALQKFNRLDAAVLNAGISVLGTVATTELSTWKLQFDVNVLGVVAGIQAALPALRNSRLPGGGRIVLTGSAVANLSPAGLAAYSASKAALNSIARSLKGEESSITTVSVHPGIVQTDLVRDLLRDGKDKVHATTYNFFEASMSTENSGGAGSRASVPPEVPAKTLAWLALNAPKELDGKFVNYSDDVVVKLVEASAVA